MRVKVQAQFLVLAAVLLLAPVQLVRPALAAAPNGGWSDAGNLSTQRGGPTVGVLLQSGKVLVTGASGGNNSGFGSVDIYDPGTGWSLGPKLPNDLPGAVAAPLTGGGALLAGGVPFAGGKGGPGPGPSATTMVYNPTTNAWKVGADMSAHRSGATASLLPDGRVMVVGGWDRRVTVLPNPAMVPFCCMDIQVLPLASTELFSATSATWTPGPSLAHGRFDHQAITLKSGRILVVGGSDRMYPEQPLGDPEFFDPASGKWLSAGNIGSPRTGFTLTALPDGRALVTGGQEDTSTVLRSTLIYDPAANQWSPGPDLAVARTGHAAALLRDGRVLVTGGADHIGRLASSELLNLSTTSWSPAGALSSARSDELAISLPNGRVLAIGGRGSSGALNTTELFDVSAAGVAAPDREQAGPGRWRQGRTAPEQTYTQIAQVLPDGRVLMTPDFAYQNFRAQLYDPLSDAWSTPIIRTSTASVFLASGLSNGKVLLLTLDNQFRTSGHAEVIDLKDGTAKPAAFPADDVYQGRLNRLADGRVWLTDGSRVFLYDATADLWAQGTDVPLDFLPQTMTALSGGRVLVGGLSKALVYDTTTGRWAGGGAFPERWSSFSALRLPSGDVLLIGGTSLRTQPDGRLLEVPASRVMRWDHSTGRFAPAESAPLVPANAAVALLADGRVLVAGGVAAIHGADPLPGVAIYNPATHSWSPGAALPRSRAQAAAVTLGDGRVLLVGGSGLLGGSQPSLLYTPESKIATAKRSPLTSVSLVLLALPLVVALLLSWRLARNRKRPD